MTPFQRWLMRHDPLFRWCSGAHDDIEFGRRMATVAFYVGVFVGAGFGVALSVLIGFN